MKKLLLSGAVLGAALLLSVDARADMCAVAKGPNGLCGIVPFKTQPVVVKEPGLVCKGPLAVLCNLGRSDDSQLVRVLQSRRAR